MLETIAQLNGFIIDTRLRKRLRHKDKYLLKPRCLLLDERRSLAVHQYKADHGLLTADRQELQVKKCFTALGKCPGNKSMPIADFSR